MIAGGKAAAPRLITTRLWPSRTSTMLTSFPVISSTMRESRSTSIGLPETTAGRESFLSFFLFSLKMAPLKASIHARQHLAAGVGDQHVVLDANAAFTRQIN